MLYGKTIVITGVSSGIGARSAELASSLGADVIGIDRGNAPTGLAAFVKADLGTADGIRALLPRLPARVDALCNVAGVSGKDGAVATLSINFYGLRALSEAMAPRIREGGAIVNAASIAGFGWRANLNRAISMVSVDGFPDVKAVVADHQVKDGEGYPVSKELLVLWTYRAAHQPLFKDRGIRVNAVSPGPVETPILGEFRTVLGDARVQSDIDRVGRPGAAADIAPVILFLCSDGARWINGVNLPADGGLEASVSAEVMGF